MHAQKCNTQMQKDTGDAILEIIASNQVKEESDYSDSSSEYLSSDSDSSDSSSPKKHWKTLQKAVKAGDIEGLASRPKKKDNWKTLSQSVNAGAHRSATEAKKPRHRSSSMIIASSDDEAGKDHWKRLSKAVKAKDFARSDSNLINSTSQDYSNELMQASDSNLARASMRQSRASLKKDNWKTLSQSVKNGEHRSGDERRSRQRSMSFDVARDGDNPDIPRRQLSKRESSRTMSRDRGSDLRRSSRENGRATSSSNLRQNNRQGSSAEARRTLDGTECL